MRLAFFVGFLCQASPRTILPRSRHLPVGVTEGSRTRNLNKSGVRLWTDREDERRVRDGDWIRVTCVRVAT
jgi:hypothetical protein